MKNLNVKHHLSLFFIALLLSQSSCENLLPNLESEISGTFYDSRNQEAIEGVVLRVVEYYPIPKKSEFDRQRYEFVRLLGNTVSNQEGYYSIPFSAQNNGNAYVLEYDIDSRYGFAPNEPVGITEIQGKNHEIKELGKHLFKDFNFWKNYYLKFRVVVHDNQYPPVLVSRDAYFGQEVQFVSGSPIYLANNDTIRYIRVVNNNTNYLSFKIIDDVGNVYRNDPEPAIEIYSDTDTIEYNEIIDIYPKDFVFHMKIN